MVGVVEDHALRRAQRQHRDDESRDVTKPSYCSVLALRALKGMVLDDADHDTWSAGSFFTQSGTYRRRKPPRCRNPM